MTRRRGRSRREAVKWTEHPWRRGRQIEHVRLCLLDDSATQAVGMWSTAHGHEAALAMPYGTVMPCLRIIIERVLFVMHLTCGSDMSNSRVHI